MTAIPCRQTTAFMSHLCVMNLLKNIMVISTTKLSYTVMCNMDQRVM